MQTWAIADRTTFGWVRRDSMQAGQCSAQAGADKLQQLQASGAQLATRSMHLLSLQDPAEQQAFAATSRQSAADLSFVTCMAVIRQTADEVRARLCSSHPAGKL
jgi:hypothetical protein